ncbi:MAG: DUF2309 domain-containing protein [Gammaproteobacteria bacterium]|nr:DUF2309 domain-containing protein [Gammaproteobacteria bacterium]
MEQRAVLDEKIDTACSRIAPLWPLKHFVAVNPFFGLSDKSFQDSSDTLARILGHGIYMSRDYYREQLANGRISQHDLGAAIERCGSQLSVEEVEQTLAKPAPRAKMGMAPMSRILERVEGGLWSSFVTERISLHCAAYFDLGQAMIAMPWRDQSLYAAWRKAASVDMGPAMMGIGDFRRDVARTPEDPREAIAWAIEELAIPEEAVERYLHASLLSIGGWAAYTRYLRWQAELNGKGDDAIVDLLAIRVVWDILLYQEKYSSALAAEWRDMLEASMRPPSAKRRAAAEIDRIMLNAMEIGFQSEVIAAIGNGMRGKIGESTITRPAVQAAFCIDVRSEVFRRSLETVSPGIQTLGFAGFFGIFIEYLPLGSSQGRSHVPVLFNPANRICERIKADDDTNQRVVDKRRQSLALSKMWKGFKYSASSAFSFVEAIGLIYAPKLLGDSFGWSRPVPNPVTQGLDRNSIQRLTPSIEPLTTAHSCDKHDGSGIPESDWLDHAERILRAMSLTDNFARLVMLTGHGSSTVNNPHATALDCGACAGQTGEASARVVTAILNQPQVRQGLRERGIDIPQDTWFIAGLHDTTTDAVTLFDTDEVPGTLHAELSQLQQWLEQAGELTRMQRATIMGLAAQDDHSIRDNIYRRASDWSQVRPEWALANNGAFIAAPRERTRGSNLEGRAFLHDYDWQQDEGFKILELILTAPMVVANWINMQYYGSVVDNDTFGSGNKVLHNIVGGAIGVLEGNGGDLRVGLPMQSLHDGKHWVHEPLRLSAFVEAPETAIDDILDRHDTVRQLVENKWLHLFHIGVDGKISRRLGKTNWDPVR